MAWLENPTVAAVLGGLAGAILTGLISIWIWRKSRSQKRIRAVIRDVTSLLDISDKLKSALNIEVQGKKITSLFLSSIDVSNVGNSSIESQSIIVAFPEGTEIIDFSLSTIPKIGFDGVSATVERNQINCHVKLLNISDKLTFEVISTGNVSEEVQVVMRNKDVKEEFVDAREGELNFTLSVLERTLMLSAAMVGGSISINRR